MLHNKRFLEAADDLFAVYDPVKYKTMKDFIIREYPYKVEFINDKVETIHGYRNLPKAVLYTPYTNRSKEIKEYALKFKALGKKFDGLFNVYIQDADPKLARKYRMQGDATYMIFDTDEEKSKYRFSDKVFNESLDVEALINFTQKFLDKKLERYIRSAEINKDDLSEPVYPVVAKTYDSVVKDPTKHVFIRFYDKMMQRFTEHFQMRKEWWKVGRNLTDNKDILICELEITDNDISEYFSRQMSAENHYFFLFTKKQKTKPYVYKGKMAAADLIAFAKDTIKKEEQVKTDL